MKHLIISSCVIIILSILITACGGRSLRSSSPEAPTPTPGPGSTRTSSVDGMVMVFIPAGTFQMGETIERALAECQAWFEPFVMDTCEESWFMKETPVHTVTLDAFWMDTHEVTNAQYAQCEAAQACEPPRKHYIDDLSGHYGEEAYANYPVVWVDWSRAAAYCAWAGRRLPTEAEWEYAARGGLDGNLYPWGDTFDGASANFDDFRSDLDDGYSNKAPVGSFPANGYGLYDMAGNVWEFVADWYSADYYSISPAENPTGPPSGDLKVARGGSHGSLGDALRVSYRGIYDYSRRYYQVGFRCALTP